jgi:hypothetical protein
MSKEKQRVYVVHYNGRGTPEANEVEDVYLSKELMEHAIYNTDKYFDLGETKEEIKQLLDDREASIYTNSYELITE